jgi:hypothetical protein
VPPSDDDIVREATNLRSAIDRAGAEPWKLKAITFPRGACCHAAELLAYHLRRRFGISTEYVCQDADGLGGWYGGHAWLEWNDVTIDISGDQFGWEPVIVTRAPTYHGQGVDQSRCPALSDMRWWALECGPLWQAIEPHLPDSR